MDLCVQLFCDFFRKINGRKLLALLLIFTQATPSWAALSAQCLQGLANTSIYGGGWIDKRLVHAEIMKGETGEETVFYETYTCINCSRENSMKPNTHEGHTTCAGCGKPHNGEPTYHKMIDGTEVVHIDDFVTKEEELPSVKKMRWKCGNCGNLIPSTEHACPGCGGHREKNSEVYIPLEAATEIKQADGHSELPEVPLITQRRMKEYTDPTPKKREVPHEEEKPWWKEPKVIGSTVAGIIGAGILGSWLMSAKDMQGKVAQMSWEHSIEVQAFQPITKEDWCSELRELPHVMPVNGSGESSGVSNIHFLEERVHHHDKVFSHTRHWKEKVPYQDEEEYDTTEEKRLKNGTTKIVKVKKKRPVTKYRMEPREEAIYDDVPRYARWCSYRTFAWSPVRTERTSGVNPMSGSDLTTPALTLGPVERSMPMKKSYQINYVYKQKNKALEYEVKPETTEEFLRWRAEDPVIVVKRNLGTISEIKKLDARK